MSIKETIMTRLHGTSSSSNAALRAALAERAARGQAALCNFGCGGRYHRDWLNFDLTGDGQAVLPWAVREGLPLPNASCDAVYASHLLEHLDRHDVRHFLAECRRVLKTGAILRLAIPDLEGIARSYLSCLESALRGEPGADARYEWSVIELLDQLVRHESGGEMLRLWRRDEIPVEEFIVTRVGQEFRSARAHWRGKPEAEHQLEKPHEVGRFRLSGEVHRWMYDRYSLERLLTECGFTAVETVDATRSAIPGFSAYELDADESGAAFKPDSLFMEAAAPL